MKIYVFFTVRNKIMYICTQLNINHRIMFFGASYKINIFLRSRVDFCMSST